MRASSTLLVVASLFCSSLSSPICHFVRVRGAGGQGSDVNGLYALEANDDVTHAWTFTTSSKRTYRLYTDDSWNWWLEDASSHETIYRAWGYVLPDDAWMPATGDDTFLPAPSLFCDYTAECSVTSQPDCFTNTQPTSGQVVGGYFESCTLPKCRLTLEYCASTCNKRGFTLAGLQNGTACTCGSEIAPWAQKDPNMAACNTPCPGDSTETCGGPTHVQVTTFTCLGPPLNQGSNAVIASCTDPASQRWVMQNGPDNGRIICLGNGTAECLG
jgi:hypothetical protein